MKNNDEKSVFYDINRRFNRINFAISTNYRIFAIDKMTYNVMDTMTLNIEIPQGVNVDAQKLSKMATDFVHHYLFLVQREQSPKRAKKSFDSFRRLRGIISSDKSYKDMVEEAILEKYENIL